MGFRDVYEDKGFKASGSTKQPSHAPKTRLIQSRGLDMSTDESEVDASEWHKVSGLIGGSFSRQVVPACSLRAVYNSSTTRFFVTDMH